MSFINTGADEALLKSLYGDSVHVDQDELCKAMNKAGLVQKDVQVRGKNGQTFTRKQWVRASDAGKDNTGSSKTGGPVDISKFSFKDYRNPDGQNMNGYKTYRESLQSIAKETEKAVNIVLSNYSGSMKPYDQLRTEFSNINSHSAYRDMISQSSEQGLKDAKSAILARQKELLESVKEYTKWDSTQRKWVKNDSQSNLISHKKADTDDKKASGIQFDDFMLTWKDSRGGHVEHCKTVEELRDKLKYYGLPESLADFSSRNINKKSIQEKGYTENSYKQYSVCAYPVDSGSDDSSSKSNETSSDIPDELKDKLKHPDDPTTPFKSKYKGFDITRFYSGKIEISKNGEKVLSTYSKPKAAEYLVNNSNNNKKTQSNDSSQKKVNADDKNPSQKLSPADAKAKTKEATKNVTDRNAFMEKAKAQGITWKENDHAGINWMRCCMAMNKHFENGGSFDASENNTVSNKDDKSTSSKRIKDATTKSAKYSKKTDKVLNDFNKSKQQFDSLDKFAESDMFKQVKKLYSRLEEIDSDAESSSGSDDDIKAYKKEFSAVKKELNSVRKTYKELCNKLPGANWSKLPSGSSERSKAVDEYAASKKLRDRVEKVLYPQSSGISYLSNGI